METSMENVVDTLVPSQSRLEGQHNDSQTQPQSQITPHHETPNTALLEQELTHLKALVQEKECQIELLHQEKAFLHAEIERLRHEIEEECVRSDALINQMQNATEASTKQANTIILNLTQQLEKQAEQIEILREFQGFSGGFRQLKAKLSLAGIGSVKRAFQPRLGAEAGEDST